MMSSMSSIFTDMAPQAVLRVISDIVITSAFDAGKVGGLEFIAVISPSASSLSSSSLLAIVFQP